MLIVWGIASQNSELILIIPFVGPTYKIKQFKIIISRIASSLGRADPNLQVGHRQIDQVYNM